MILDNLQAKFWPKVVHLYPIWNYAFEGIFDNIIGTCVENVDDPQSIFKSFPNWIGLENEEGAEEKSCNAEKN